MEVFNVPNLIAVGTVLNANRTSSAQQVHECVMIALQITIAGTPTGSFVLQGSNDPFGSGQPGQPVPTHWTDIDDSTTAVSAAGSIMYNLPDIAFNWVRAAYTDTSSGMSTATITQCTFNGKGF